MHLQEVNEDMYKALKETFRGWHFLRWPGTGFGYFPLIASNAPFTECRLRQFAEHTRQGRHALIVRCGPWVFTNVHAESG
eukprot:11315056-Karenia_brevis.AAC.1